MQAVQVVGGHGGLGTQDGERGSAEGGDDAVEAEGEGEADDASVNGGVEDDSEQEFPRPERLEKGGDRGEEVFCSPALVGRDEGDVEGSHSGALAEVLESRFPGFEGGRDLSELLSHGEDVADRVSSLEQLEQLVVRSLQRDRARVGIDVLRRDVSRLDGIMQNVRELFSNGDAQRFELVTRYSERNGAVSLRLGLRRLHVPALLLAQGLHRLHRRTNLRDSRCHLAPFH
mmetsp:Transcript_24318/g.75995  ORF Transcript_24318/g.75995 Transcript_24318/m.75995 type:complete len:230 (-) Transcript_24318:409-1098(-)